MEFAVPEWDPYKVKYINKLEMVQHHAAWHVLLNPIIVVQPHIWVGEPFQIAEKMLI